MLALSSPVLAGAGGRNRPQRQPAPAPPPAPHRAVRPNTGAPARREVLDIQNLRVAPAPRFPNDIPTCDVLVVGGGLGGVAAAEALARRGRSVILTEPTSMLGGQLTSQAVCLPDENSYIEREPGAGTRSYRELREELRARYAITPGIVPGRAQSVGQAWVSRISGEPMVWEQVIRARLARLSGSGGVRRVLTRHQLVEVRRFAHNGRYHYADFVDLDSGRLIRVAARYLLDATEFGEGLEAAGSPFVVGQEGKSEHQEPHAPPTPRPDWIQSLTYCFAVRWQPDGPHTLIEKPAEYEYFKSLGEYTLGYDYVDRGRVYYKVFERVPGAGGPFWTYRRIVAASSFRDNPRYTRDLALINWRGNDFHEENPIGKSLPEQIRILQRAKAFAQGFLYWLQQECPRDDGGTGYPEMQLDREALGSADGFSLHPYVRESRRLQARFTLTENHLAPDPSRPERAWGEEFSDTVGIALYAVDIHPAKGEPPLLVRALPYHLPLGAFLPAGGPANVLPAAKNFGATRLALASARMHPTEWLAGEVAGNLAAFCLEKDLLPDAVREQTGLLQEFQQRLETSGIPLRWSTILKTP